MPCYRCGVRQTDPERGKSPWRRGVLRDELVLVCPACQESGDWTAELEACSRCASAHEVMVALGINAPEHRQKGGGV